MSSIISFDDFLSMIKEYCMEDHSFRREIERVSRFGTYRQKLETAHFYVHNGLSLREAFGMTNRTS